jgi:nucleoid-associated protein YgaU
MMAPAGTDSPKDGGSSPGLGAEAQLDEADSRAATSAILPELAGANGRPDASGKATGRPVGDAELQANHAESLASTAGQDGEPNPSAAATRTTSTRGDSERRAGPGAMTLYTIKAGDSLGSIAAEWFGRAVHWPLILDANPGLEPKRMQIGQQIILPSRDLPQRLAEAKAKNDDGRARKGPRRAGQGPDESAPAANRAATAAEDRSGVPGAAEHIVRSGETLSAIAKQHYGKTSAWRRIYDANRALIGKDPDALEVGMVLVIPREDNPPEPNKMAKG